MEQHLPFQRIKVLTAGILSLILMLGIARFAYTPLLPVMQQQAGLGVTEGGWLASINYIGYLCGAIIASLISDLQFKDRLYRIGLIVAVATTVIMGLTDNLWLWSLSRFFAGLSSAAGLLIGSGLIMHWLLRNNHRSELGIHFSGIGLGIAFSALAVELMSEITWDQQWQLLSIAGAVLLIPAWRWLPTPGESSATNSGERLVDNPPSRTFLLVFMAAYFCAGVGYVVSATFIVDIIEQIPGLSDNGNWTFLLLGLGAAPACIVWDLIARRTGDLNALILAFILQIVSILMPLTITSLTGAILSALLFGSTFVGIVSLVLTMAGRYYPTRPAKMMGKMTISYGTAQIAAPAITGLLAQQSGSYSDGLYLAAGMMLVGALLMLQLKRLETAISRKDAKPPRI